MGGAASLYRGEERREGPSQLRRMTAYLDEIPAGAASQDKVRRVRLIKKRALLSHPVFRELFSRVSEIVREVSVDHGTLSADDGGGSRRVATHSVSEKGLRMIEHFSAQAAERRVSLEELLCWRSAATDSLCEIFDLSECPPFSFVSHRWAPQGRALGLHNELVFLLAFVPQEHLWLDCCCSPQDNDSFESGNCLKVIWNIASLLDRASDIVTYYATDGVQVSRRTQQSGEEVQTLSHGLARLFACATQSRDEQLLADLAGQDAQGSARLWCVLEKRLGKEKIATTLQSSLFAHIPVNDDNEVDDPYDELPRKDTRSFADVALQDNYALHEEHKLSLDCFCAADIEPVTAVMFQRRAVPVVFRDNWPVVPDDNNSDNFLHAIRLPCIVAKEKGERGERSYRACEVKELNGWYYNDVLAQNLLSVETLHLNILWPQNPSVSKIHLQAHVPCLLQHNQPLWRYDVDEARKKKGFFNRVFDSPSRNKVFLSQCLFCTVDDAEEMFCDESESEPDEQQEQGNAMREEENGETSNKLMSDSN